MGFKESLMGYLYKNKLKDIVTSLGLENNVIFYDRFVSKSELNDLLAATDIYVTPYLNKEQLTSGTLAFAVGSGKAVVATPYWAAEELLADGRGVLVPFNDSKKMAEEINHLLSDEQLLKNIMQRAYDYGRAITWSNIGMMYWEIFNAAKLHSNISVVLKSKNMLSAETLKNIVGARLRSVKKVYT